MLAAMRVIRDENEISRRALLGDLAASATVLLTAFPVDATTDTLERHSLTLSNGRKVSALLGLPRRRPAPGVMLVHEWWGVNERIKAVTRDLVEEGFAALAIDLMHGGVATVRNDAKRLLGRVGRKEALETCGTWLRWLKALPECNGRAATIGWSFGGGWALSAATIESVDATVVYYGRVNHPTTELARLRGPVMGHFALHDVWINRDMVTLFESGMLKAGKRSISHWYDAGHAFADPTAERHDPEASALAWRRTLMFLRESLR